MVSIAWFVLVFLGVLITIVLAIPWVGFIACSLWPSWLSYDRYLRWCNHKQCQLVNWAREQCQKRGIKYEHKNG